MAIIDSAVLLLQAKNYGGAGNWLDESGNSHDAVPAAGGAAPTFDVDHFDLDGDDYFTVADHGDLDFAAAESFTLIVAYAPTDATPANTAVLVDKRQDANFGYSMYVNQTTGNTVSLIGDDSSDAWDAKSPETGDGVKTYSALRVDRSAEEIEAFANGVPSGSPTDTTGLGTLAGTGNFVVGAVQGWWSGDFYIGEIMAVALWRSALSDADIATAGDELLYGVPAVSGTCVAGGVLESEIVTGGETIIITLDNDTWDANVGDDHATTTALIAGIDSGGAAPAGWDAVVKANMVFGDVTRDSDTQVTILLGAEAAYVIPADETITITVPANCLTGSGAMVAAPTFAVTAEAAAGGGTKHNVAGPGQILQTG